MNSRQLILILGIAAALVTIAWILFHRGARSWESQPTSGDTKVIEFSLNDVVHITITDGASELNLVRQNDGWVVRERADYPANFEQISRLLQKLWNLKPVQTLQVGPSQLQRFDLIESATDAKSGTLIELKNKDEKRIAALLVGKQYLKKSSQSSGPAGFPAGRYVMPEDGSMRVALVSDSLQDLVTKPERWLDHDFIKIEKPQTIALDRGAPTTNWKLVRENESADWRLADAKPGEELDEAKASTLASSVSNLRFTDVLDLQAKPETTGLDHPSVVRIGTSDGFTYTLRIGKQSGETYPVQYLVEATLPAQSSPVPNEKPEERKKREEESAKGNTMLEEKLAKEKKFEGRPFLINKFAVEQLLKNRADLIKTQPSPTFSSPPKPPMPLLERPGAKPPTPQKTKP